MYIYFKNKSINESEGQETTTRVLIRKRGFVQLSMGRWQNIKNRTYLSIICLVHVFTYVGIYVPKYICMYAPIWLKNVSTKTSQR